MYEELDPKDLRVDTYVTGSWIKVNNGIKIKHRPTGITAECDEERSQHANKARAYEKLKYLVATSWHKPTEKQRIEELEEENQRLVDKYNARATESKQMYKSLKGWRSRTWPNTDQDTVLLRDYPLTGALFK